MDLIASWVTKVTISVPLMNKASEQAKVLALGVMDPLISVNGKMESDMERESTLSQMELPTMANGLLTKSKALEP